jgi:L-fuculose-phosphate aldolase
MWQAQDAGSCKGARHSPFSYHRAVDHGEARERVAATSRALAAEGLVLGTAGNVSQRSGDAVAISPTGAILADVDAGDVAVVDLDGRQLEGPLAPTSEIDLHLGAIRRHGAGAVVHTHAPMSTAAACVLDELPCVHYGMLALGGPVPVAPYETFGTPELAASVVDALEGRTAVLMANHGAVTVGDTAEAALDLALLLEWAATVYLHAAGAGRPRELDETQRAAVIEAALARGYGSTKEVEGG